MPLMLLSQGKKNTPILNPIFENFIILLISTDYNPIPYVYLYLQNSWDQNRFVTLFMSFSWFVNRTIPTMTL